MSYQGLRGHETVIRMVGKRRKLTLSAISPQKPGPHEVKREGDCPSTSYDTKSELNIEIKTSAASRISYHEDIVAFQAASSGKSQLPFEQTAGNVCQNGVGAAKTSGYVDWVQCPVCSKSIRGDVVNSHLDVCLQGGMKATKRKSKQLTMSQFGGSNCQKGTSVENGMSFGHPLPVVLSSQGTDTCESKIHENSKGFRGVKLENYGPVGTSQTESLGPVNGSCQSRMRTNRLKLKNGNTSKDESFKREEEDRQKEECSSLPGSLGRGSKDGLMLGTGMQPLINSKILEQERLGCEMDRVADALMESLPATQDRNCSCACHFSSMNAINLGNGREKKVWHEGSGEQNLDFRINIEKVSDRIQNSDLPEVKTSASTLEIGTADGHDFQSTDEVGNENLVGVLDTKIVGRRYNRSTSCKEGMHVTLLREPDNPKDPNAIKIVETPSGPVLGHLAREISLHLSRLLDQGFLQVSGSVTSIPEQPFGPVPVQLFCRSPFSKEEFFKLEGTEESFMKVGLAAETLQSLQQSSLGNSGKYQQNFIFMLQTIMDRDSHLFNDNEKTFLETFSTLSDDAKRLFIRLYQRKGPWFRLSSIEYRDVADADVAAEELLASGYMTSTDNTDEDSKEEAFRKRFQTLSVLELRQFVCTTLLKKKSEVAAAKKEDLISTAMSAGMQKHLDLLPETLDQSGSTLMKMLVGIAGKCIRVSDMADFLLWRLKRLFFLNGEVDFSAFLLVDMGLVKYPRYKCWRARNVFGTREDLLSYEQALEVAQGMDMALECNDMDTALKLLKMAQRQMSCEDSNQAPVDRTPTFLARFSASYVYKNVCTLGVSILERERKYCEAVDVLRQLLSCKTIKSGRWGYWTVRLSLDLDHLGRKEESLQVAEDGVNDPWIRGGDRVSLQRRVVRLGKPPRRWKKPPYAAALNRNCREVQIQGRPLSSVTGMKSRFYGYDGEQCGVEELALQFYASDEGGGWQGVHCEGGVWMTFFGLLMWDVLFADVPDVFQTSFQTAPLDLDTEVFFSSRQSLIEAQLDAIAQGDTASLLACTWNQHLGTLCRGVNWERHSLEELQTIASCIGGPGLSAVCRLLAEDHAGWTSGMPDLLLWRISPSGDSEHLPSQVSRDLSLCNNCCCISIEKAPSVSSKQKTSSTSVEFREGLEQMSEISRQSLHNSRGLTSASSTTKNLGKRGDAKLVEVKGPRDRLSEQQRAWIWILMNAGLDIEVCKVLEQLTE